MADGPESDMPPGPGFENRWVIIEIFHKLDENTCQDRSRQTRRNRHTKPQLVGGVVVGVVGVDVARKESRLCRQTAELQVQKSAAWRIS